jgi:hypothetical protein
VPIEIVSGSLVDVVAAEMAPAPNDAEIDGASRLGGIAADAPRRAPRVRVQAPRDPSATPPPSASASAAATATATDPSEVRKPACTLAQMRRFIKSRPYVPVHELRRRFLIEGNEDDVNAVPTEEGIVYVGLPETEAKFLADLIKAGEVGCELLLDPTSPAVVGVYAMRPVSRQ